MKTNNFLHRVISVVTIAMLACMQAWALGGVAATNDLKVPNPEATISSDFMVTITCEEYAGVKTNIYYRIDGTDWIPYEGPFRLKRATWVVSRATRDGWEDSDETWSDFYNDYYTNRPSISWNEETRTVTITHEESDAKIYYTIDGSEPTEESIPYTGPFTVNRRLWVRASAVRPGRLLSDIEEYTTEVETRFYTNGFYYRLTDNSTANEIEVTDGAAYKGDLTIPSTVENGGVTYTVTRIGNNAFNDRNELGSIILPNTIRSIGQQAFWSCDKLKKIDIPTSVQSIEENAFDGCPQLKEVTLHEGLQSIGNSAFCNCGSLKTISIPGTVTYLGYGAFRWCYQLSNINLPDGLANISGEAFYGCSALQSIKLPSALTKIENYMLAGTGINSIDIPASVKEIRENAFFGCSQLTSITIPEGITEVKFGTFDDCTALAVVSLPSTLTTIEGWAFNTCRNLSSIIIPENVTYIGREAFTECDKLNDIYCTPLTPPSMSDGNAFSDCFERATLYVKSEALTKYQTATYWAEFNNKQTFEQAPCAQPTFILENYMLSMQSQTAGAVIHYTTDGSEPAESSPTYTQPIPFVKNGTVKAIAIASGYTSSMVSEFTSSFKVPTPFITMSDDFTVTITCDKPEGIANFPETKIEYHTWETDWTPYEGPFQLKRPTWVSARATRDGWNDSDEIGFDANSEYYTNQPSFSTEQNGNIVTVTLGHDESDAKIYYTLDGSEPTTNSTPYTAPFTVNRNLTVKAIAVRPKRFVSDVTVFDIGGIDSKFTVDGICYDFAKNSTGNDVEVANGGNYTGDITIPATVTKDGTVYQVVRIGNSAFMQSHGLTSISIPNSVTSIGDNAFYDCSQLTSVTLPHGLNTLGEGAFNSCPHLSSISIPEGITTLRGWTLGWCHALTTVSLPKTLTTIENDALHGCYNLTTITLPANVTSIGNNAFAECSTLQSIYSLSTTPPTITDGNPFEGITNQATLYVKTTAADAYKNANIWSEFSSIKTFENEPCAQPTFAWANYQLTMSSLTPNATIYYTTDDSDPAISSTRQQYSQPVPFYKNGTIRAIAVANGYDNSVESVFSKDDFRVPNPVATLSDDLKVTITCETPEGIANFPETKIEYHTWEIDWTPYEGPFQLKRPTYVFARATRDGWNDSEESEFDFFTDYYTEVPSITWDEESKTITITHSESDATIYYTLDGSEPTEQSTRYTAPFKLNRTITVKAIAKRAGRVVSDINEYWVEIDTRFVYNGMYFRLTDYSTADEVEVTNGITYEGDITIPTTVEFGNTTCAVVRVGNSAFLNCENLSTVTIPSTIRSIGQQAFQNCNKLKEVDIPANVQSIEDNAFSGCYQMEKVVLHEGLQSIGNGAFSSCSALKAIDIPNTVTSLGSSVFAWCGQLSNINLPDGLADIGREAFYGCSALQSIKLPSALTKIENYMLAGTGINSIDIPASVKEIRENAFFGCSQLTSITIPEGITEVKFGTFDDCTALAVVSLPSTLTTIEGWAFNTCRNLSSITIPENVTYIGASAFTECDKLNSIYCLATTPPSMSDGNAFADCLQRATLFVKPEALTKYQTATYWAEFNNKKTFDKMLCAQPTFILENYMLSMQSQTAGAVIHYTTDGSEPTENSTTYTQPIPFVKNGTVKAIAIANGYDNSLVSELTTDFKVPTPVITKDANNVVTITCNTPEGIANFPETKIEYHTWEFDWTPYEGPFQLKRPTYVYARATRDGWNDSDEAGFDFYNDYYVNQPNIEITYDDDMNRKSATVKITHDEADANIYYTLDGSEPTPNSTLYKEPFTVYRNLHIRAIATRKGRINSDVSEVWTENIDTKFQSNGITYKLADNTLADELEVVGVTTSQTGSFTIPASVTDRGITYAVTIIGRNAFSSQQITSITLPQTIRRIENEAFYSCQKLTSVTTTAKIEYIGPRAFRECTSLEEFPFNDGLTTIDGNAFSNTALKSVTLPNSLTTMTGETFYGCSKLTSITLSEKLTGIPYDAFNSCSTLTTITLPASVKEIGMRAFANCAKLTSISIPQGVDRIQEEAFYNCQELASVLLPQSLTAIEGRAFYNCRKLTTIALHSNMKTIDSGAFFGCTGLINVISEALTPPLMANGNAFESNTLEQATLFVKESALEAYSRDSEWVKFTNRTKFESLPCEQPTFVYEDYVLTISSATPGAVIHYTTDGTDPTTSSPICNGSIYLMQNDTIRAIAAAEGYDNSSVAVYRKTDFRVPTPTATLSDDLVMTLNCETPDLPNFPQTRFFYNQNMSVSTAGTEWIPYNGPVQLTEPGYVHVRAERDNWLTSVVRHANFYTAYYLAPPTIVGDTLSAKTVTITHSQSDAVIYYTLDGTEPSPSSTLYTEAITLTQNTTVKAMATLAKHFNSKSSTKSYKSFTLPAPEIAFEGRYCTITCSEPDVAIYYTIDQTTPTRESNRYSTPFILPQETTHVIAFAVKDNWNDSPTRESIFYADDSRRCAKPVVLRDGSTNNVRMSTTTTGGVIHYTTDGNDPTANSPIYTEPIEMKENLTVKAITTSDNYFDSEITEFKVNWFQVNKPVIHVEGLYVSITCAKEGAKIYYTLDGTTPTIESELYTERLTMTKACTIKAMATYENFNNSDIAEVQFDPRENKCGTPEFTIDGNMVTITATPIGEGTIIYYTINGTEPTEASIVYTKPIEVTENCMIKALATNPILFNSDIDSLKVNWFKVEKPVIALNGTTVTISCSTPGATVYYAYDETPTAESEVYTQPITIVDNRTIQAIGLKPNFNPSEVATYTPTLFVCDDVAFNYNGRYLQMTTNEGATIYYTTDGTRPTAQSRQYTAPVDIDALCSVNAIAMRKDYRNSSMTTYKVTYVYTGEEAKFEEAGHLEEVFNWAGGANNVESLPIQGKLNDKDLSFIRNISSLRHLDLTDATIEGNTLPDKAFANLPLLSVQLPTQLTSVGDHLFEGCNDLAAIVWNANLNIPQTVIDDIKNPNMLLYANASLYVPNSYTGNLILGTNATSITLTDTESGGNFYCPKRFYAEQISYTHQYSQPTASGETRTQGWETLSLPFDVQNITHEKNGALAPFAKGEDVTKFKPFWLYKLEDTGFMRAAEIQAYTPYIISMPNNASYADDYNLVGRVTFSSTGVYVEEDMANITAKGSIRFTPALQNREKASNVMAINKTDYTDEDGTFSVNGSAFISNLRDVRPFEAYARVGGGLSRLLIGEFLWSDDTAIRSMEMKQLEAIGLKRGIYDLSGRHLSNDSSILQKKRGQHQRVLIINGKKTLQK